MTLGRRSWIPQETVVHTVRVGVVSRNGPRVIDAVRKGSAARTCGRARAGSIERDELAPGGAQETVVHNVRVSVVSRDSPAATCCSSTHDAQNP